MAASYSCVANTDCLYMPLTGHSCHWTYLHEATNPPPQIKRHLTFLLLSSSTNATIAIDRGPRLIVSLLSNPQIYADYDNDLPSQTLVCVRQNQLAVVSASPQRRGPVTKAGFSIDKRWAVRLESFFPDRANEVIAKPSPIPVVCISNKVLVSIPSFTGRVGSLLLLTRYNVSFAPNRLSCAYVHRGHQCST